MVLQITPSERAALQLLANGKATSEIASHLGVTELELGPHLTKLFSRMGAASRTEAVAVAFRRGLVSQGGHKTAPSPVL